MSRNKPYQKTLEREHLIGPVKQVKQTTYNVVKRGEVYVAGQLHEYGFYNRLLNFSRDGVMERELHFTISGVEREMVYTPTGKLAKIVSYAKTGALESTTFYTYNDEDLLVQTRSEHPNGEHGKLWISENKYDERGFSIGHTITVDGKLHGRQSYRNDDEGNILGQWMYNDKDELYRRIEYTYNTAGDQLTHKEYDGSGKLTKDGMSHYDDSGKFIGSTEDGVYTDYSAKRPEQPNDYEYDHHQNWTKEVDYERGKPGCRPEYIRYRTITYYGEPSASEELSITDTIHDMAAMHNPIEAVAESNNLGADQWRWIAEASTDDAPFSVRRFYTATHGFLPSRAELFVHQIDLFSLRRHLISKFGATEVWGQSEWRGNSWDEQHEQFILAFPRAKYLLEAANIQHLTSYRQYEFKKTPIDPDVKLGNYVQFGDLFLHYPPNGTGLRDPDFEKELEDLINIFRVRKEDKVPQISMVTMQGPSFALKAYKVKDDFAIADLDLHYGNGFEKFDADLMEKFRSSTQGLILFHGEPGTGKTFYVRHLLRKMSESKKVVIYMPPNMVDHLADPSFMTFISGRINVLKAEGKSCIMLIEDAEPLLVSRDENTRIQGITNLLNMTDGLLNDMLGLQIICTFNVPLKQLDKALLRPGRLIARKEFKALPEFEANILAHSLGIKHVFNRPATLGEIYAKAPDKKMLTHDA